MPLVGEQAWEAYAYSIQSDYYSASWDLDFPPSPAFIKVFLGSHAEAEDKSWVWIGLLNIRRLRDDGTEELIPFPDIVSDSRVLVQYNPTMTHVTFGIRVAKADAMLVWTLGFWE